MLAKTEALSSYYSRLSIFLTIPKDGLVFSNLSTIWSAKTLSYYYNSGFLFIFCFIIGSSLPSTAIYLNISFLSYGFKLISWFNASKSYLYSGNNKCNLDSIAC